MNRRGFFGSLFGILLGLFFGQRFTFDTGSDVHPVVHYSNGKCIITQGNGLKLDEVWSYNDGAWERVCP